MILGAAAVVALAAGLWLTRAPDPAPSAGEEAPPPLAAPAMPTAPAEAGAPTAPQATAPPERAAAEPLVPSPELAELIAGYRRSADPVERELAVSDISMSEEPAALAFLIDELTRAKGAEREVLLEGVIDFGSRDAIPALLDLAKSSDDPEHQAALREAAEYLALPTLTEVRKGKVALPQD